MNLYVKLLLPFVFIGLLSSCQKNNGVTTFSGTIPDLKNETVKLIAVDQYFPGLETEGILQTKTDSVGNFSFKIQHLETGFYQVVTDQSYAQLQYDIFLQPGDSIFIKQPSWDETPSLIISGLQADRFNYLLADYKLFPKDRVFYDTIRGNHFKTELVFKHFIDSLCSLRIKQLNEDLSTNEDLKSYLVNVIKAEQAIILLGHLERRNYIMNDKFGYFFPDTSYYSFYEEITFDEDFCKSSAAKELSNDYLNNQTRKIFGDLGEKKWWEEGLSRKFKFILEQPKSKWTDLLALSSINEYPFGLMQDNFFGKFIDFKKSVEDHFSLDYNRKLFLNNTDEYLRLAPGNPAPDFSLPDSSGLVKSLSEFKEKIVYIDFWGTWCYPCIQEIPNLVDLQTRYADQPIVFLFVALEADQENIKEWKNFIAGKNERFKKFLDGKPFPGVHLVAEKQFRNEALKPYKIGFAPTYVLVDHEGNIASPRAKSAKDISAEIESLLEKMKSKVN
jgi:thiol-disulfide isomerase/thioredoxin